MLSSRPDRSERTRVAVIGCGRMGAGIATALTARGFAVNAYDASRTALDRLVADAPGVVASDSVASAIADADTLLTVVPGPSELAAVAQDVLTAATRQMTWLQMSTVGPGQIRELARGAKTVDVNLTDVALVGTPALARTGQLTLLVGAGEGDDGVDEALLSAVGTTVWCGELGIGMTLKVIANLLGGAITTATGEALALGRRSGIPDDLLVGTLMKTGASNAQLEGPYPERAMRGDITPRFSTNLALKDIELGLELATELEVPAPTSQGARSALVRASAVGYGEADVTALLIALLGEP